MKKEKVEKGEKEKGEKWKKVKMEKGKKGKRKKGNGKTEELEKRKNGGRIQKHVPLTVGPCQTAGAPLDSDLSAPRLSSVGLLQFRSPPPPCFTFSSLLAD